MTRRPCPGLRSTRVVACCSMTANGTTQSFSTRSVLNAGALVFAASMILSVGGFVFHAVASRRLGVDDYGALYALISLYTIAGVPASLFSPVVTKYAAEFRALHDDSHVRGLIDLIVRAFGAFGLVYIVLGVALAVPIGSFLHVPGWEIPIVGVMAAIGILSSTLRSIGQGVHDYGAYGLSIASEGVGKVVALLIFSVVGLTIFRGVLSFAIGMLVGVVFVFFPLAKRYFRIGASSVSLDWQRILGTTAGAASLTLTMALIGFGDVLIVKHAFSPSEAGLYSVASLSAKVLLYFVGFVPAILIPQATHRHARGERTRRTLFAACVFVAVVSLAGVAAYRVFGALLLHLLVGPAFDAALPLLPTYAGAMAFLAMTNTLGSYALATHRLAFVVPLVVATIGTLAFIAAAHPSLAAVAQELLVGNIVMFSAVGVPLAIQGLQHIRK